MRHSIFKVNSNQNSAFLLMCRDTNHHRSGKNVSNGMNVVETLQTGHVALATMTKAATVAFEHSFIT